MNPFKISHYPHFHYLYLILFLAMTPPQVLAMQEENHCQNEKALEKNWEVVEEGASHFLIFSPSPANIEMSITDCLKTAKNHVSIHGSKTDFQFFELLVKGIDKKIYGPWCTRLGNELYHRSNTRNPLLTIAKGFLGDSYVYSYHAICIDSFKKACW